MNTQGGYFDLDVEYTHLNYIYNEKCYHIRLYNIICIIKYNQHILLQQ